MKYMMIISEKLEYLRYLQIESSDKMHYSELMKIMDDATDKAIKDLSFTGVSEYLQSKDVSIVNDSGVDYSKPQLAIYEVLNGNAIQKNQSY